MNPVARLWLVESDVGSNIEGGAKWLLFLAIKRVERYYAVTMVGQFRILIVVVIAGFSNLG